MKLEEIVTWCDELLRTREFAKADVALNGLQVGLVDRDQEITKVAFTVDACMEAFVRAAECGAQLLFVHHGLFWGSPLAVTGAHMDRISYLLQQGIALYAAHLPLDAHPTVGNNARIAEVLGLTSCEPFGEYHGVRIGYKGVLPEACDVDSLVERLGLAQEASLSVLPFGRKEVRTVGIVSGAAVSQVSQALEEQLDVFITGEPSHQIYHQCLEQGITVIAGGHYRTEVFGPEAMCRLMKKELGVETQFIEVPTGL